MSKENVEIVRAGFEAWNAGEMDALRELLDADIMVRPAEGWPEPGPYVGRDAAMRFYEQLRETWDADTLEPTSDYLDGADRVAVRYAWHATGHGPSLNLAVSVVWSVRKGKVCSVEFFWDHAEALKAAGLEE
jgi:uncharacterized protein